MSVFNLIPQIKIWNAAEFVSRRIWENVSPGFLTYDANCNKFAVSLGGDERTKWKFLLTSDSSVVEAATVMRLKLNENTFYDASVDSGGILTLYTASPYAGPSNPVATLADVMSAVEGGSLLGLKVDSSIARMDSSYIMLKTDPSNLYRDYGRGSSADVNPLATVATVTSAIEEALNKLGDLLNLQGVYPNPYEPEQGTRIESFADLLSYLIANSDSPFEIKKGTVIIFGTEEYVLLDIFNYATPLGWEKLGIICDDTNVISIGGISGVIEISDSFYINGNTLSLNIASDASLGGIKTGYPENVNTVSKEYNIALNVVPSGSADTGRGYVTLPIVTGKQEDASYGVVPNSILVGNAQIYTITLDPSSLTGIDYEQIRSVNIRHNMNTDNVVVNIYKRRDNVQRIGRQLVLVDEVIVSGNNSILIDFGSPEAFIGCQDKRNNEYLGYDIIISASDTEIHLNDSSYLTFTLNINQ